MTPALHDDDQAGPADLHLPVLPGEVLAGLEPAPGEKMVDGTVGLGGHARLLAERLGPGGALLALDRDPAALRRARVRLADAPCPVHFAHDSFERLGRWVERLGWGGADGILLDLGVSSMQLDFPERGFSFMRDGPLDMRMDPTRGATAAMLVAQLPEKDLADLFWTMGEERHSRRIAKSIVENRLREPITTTGQLAELVARSVPGRGRHHPATRVFQALRMAVNDEPGALARGLERALSALSPGGRLAVITFHSLEDRWVKRAFRGWEDAGRGRRRYKKAVLPGRAECRENRRARSAKLRVFIRADGGGGTP